MRKSKKKSKAPVVVVPASSTAAVIAKGQSSAADTAAAATLLPPPFPAHLPRPSVEGFLRNEHPYKESFQAALDTSYEGFVVDEDVVTNEAEIQHTLRSERMCDMFRTDVTQPFGLGTACAKTYVTRCLLGDAGTTYKYLGLRMFAHPWRTIAPDHTNRTIDQLRRQLTRRVTDTHLPALHTKRAAAAQNTAAAGQAAAAAATVHQGSSNNNTAVQAAAAAYFDVCLINRMTCDKHLKAEPLDADKHLQTAVSWHADSSLQHYSTIAVYQTILPLLPHPSQSQQQQQPPPNNNSGNNDSQRLKKGHGKTSVATNEWSIALRVAHNAEGPGSGHLTEPTVQQQQQPETTTMIAPPIAVSLPSNSAYYMLDDFNHHHQHTVLTTSGSSSGADSTTSVRYSLTFRLLRESHNVSHMLERCQRVVAHFHKKGRKLYRSEQLLLTELESEWLCQFYIQGSQHRALLWGSWGDAIRHLWSYWSQLETRTHQTVTFLRLAAEGRCCCCVQSSLTSDMVPTKAERKLRDKRKKAVATMQELLDRESSYVTHDPERGGAPPTPPIYESMAALLEERAVMRELWAKREKDRVFREMSQEYRPLPRPCRYGRPMDEKPTTPMDEQGSSPMPGTPEELRQVAANLRFLGRAFVSRNATDLPKLTWPEPAAQNVDRSDNHTRAADWSGWTEYEFGLEMQCPWAGALLQGRKTIETRAYDLPPALRGQKIVIIETPKGKEGGGSSMGNQVDFATTSDAKIVGWCKFSSMKKYTSSQDFARDEKAHLVHQSSGFGWKEGTTDLIYGWVVSECGGVDDETLASRYKSGTRRLRSLYQLTARENKDSKPPRGNHKRQHGKAKSQSNSGSKKEKKRRF